MDDDDSCDNDDDDDDNNQPFESHALTSAPASSNNRAVMYFPWKHACMSGVAFRMGVLSSTSTSPYARRDASPSPSPAAAAAWRGGTGTAPPPPPRRGIRALPALSFLFFLLPISQSETKVDALPSRRSRVETVERSLVERREEEKRRGGRGGGEGNERERTNLRVTRQEK